MISSYQTLSSEARYLAADDPTGAFEVLLPRERDHEYDADQKLWQALEIPSLVIGAFSHITAEDLQRAFSLVEEADLTVLCSFPIGPGNQGNLELAGHARRLVILESGPREEPRLFFSPSAQSEFSALAAKSEQMDYGRLCELLESGEITPEAEKQSGGKNAQA